MTIDKAIELLDQDTSGVDFVNYSKLVDAEKLGIEALKAWREHRKAMSHPKNWLLPGETKD